MGQKYQNEHSLWITYVSLIVASRSVHEIRKEEGNREKLSVPERSEGTELSKMAICKGAVFWGVWGGFPPL